MTRSYDLNHPLNDQFADCCNQLISWSISLVWSMFLTLALSEQKLIYNDSIQGDNPTFIKMSWCTIGETKDLEKERNFAGQILTISRNYFLSNQITHWNFGSSTRELVSSLSALDSRWSLTACLLTFCNQLGT